MSAYHFLKNFLIVYVDRVVANFAGYSIERKKTLMNLLLW